MAQLISPTYDASTEKDLRVLLGYDVVFLVDDVVSKTLRSSWTDVGPPFLLEPLAIDSSYLPSRPKK